MNIRVAPDTIEKMALLADATRFEAAGDSPHREGASEGVAAALEAGTPPSCFVPNTGAMDGEIPLTAAPPTRSAKRSVLEGLQASISMAATPKGPKPLLKGMVTTACERNCYYCPFRAGRSRTQRISFSPDELAKGFDQLQRAKMVDGLFLSSGIIGGGPTAQDKIIASAEILRRKYSFGGYIHLKIMPGAEYEQIRQAMRLADRVSINLEGATAQRLAALAPMKSYWDELLQRMTWVHRIRQEERLRTSLATQFVVGAVGDTDLELLAINAKLYSELKLARVYFSAFNPVGQTPFEDVTPVLPLREFRLYQASFLLRDYGWDLEEMSFQGDQNLRLDVDPKQAWADKNLRHAPVDLSTADRPNLLRVPGIGPKSADAILAARRQGEIRDVEQLRAVGVAAPIKALPYVLFNGRRPAHQPALW